MNLFKSFLIPASEPLWDVLYITKAEHAVNFSTSFQAGSVSGEGEINVTSQWMVDPGYTEFKTARVDSWSGVHNVSTS